MSVENVNVSSHGEDPFFTEETWTFFIDKSGDAKGKRKIKFTNPTKQDDLPLVKNVVLKFDRPASEVKLDGTKLIPKDSAYKIYSFELNDKINSDSSIIKTIEFEYSNFVSSLSKNNIVTQYLHSSIVDSPLLIDLIYYLPKKHLWLFSYITDLDKNSKVRYNRNKQRFTCKVESSNPYNEIKFLYRPRSFISIFLSSIVMILGIIAIYYLVSSGQKIEFVISTVIIAIICSIIASKIG